MLCPRCTRPFYFLDPFDVTRCRCRRCGNTGAYETYHGREAASPSTTQSEYRRDKDTDPLLQRILQTLQISRDDIVLNLGCDSGDTSAAAAQYSKHVIGVDTDVASARLRHPGVQFLAHCFDQPLPFADASVDVLLSLHLIAHVRHADGFLRECQRVLRPQGRIAIVTANLDFVLHRHLFDPSNLQEWTLAEFRASMGRFFVPAFAEKSSSMFQLHPLNKLLAPVLKPDLLFVGLKPRD